MKFATPVILIIVVGSHPSRVAWIEIESGGVAGIEAESHPSRGAWIEIDFNVYYRPKKWVAPLTGCVD